MLILLLFILNALQIHAWTLTLYDKPNFGGPAEVFGGSTGTCEDLKRLNRKVSSFQWSQGKLRCCVTFYAGNSKLGYRCDDSSSRQMISDNEMTRFCVDRCFF